MMASAVTTPNNVAPPPVLTAFIRDNSTDFFAWIDQEEGENLAASIVRTIVTKGQEVLFEKHIESQVLPYAVQFAKENMLKIVEWQYYRRDPGDIESCTWLPDEEPNAAIADSWSRGAITMRPKPAKAISFNQREAQLSTNHAAVAAEEGDTDLIEATSCNSGSESIIEGKVASVASLGSRHSTATKKTLSQSVIGGSTGSRILGKSSVIGLNPGASPRSYVRAAIGSADVNDPGNSTSLAVEREILEENKKAVARLQNGEKEVAKADLGYDADGRIVVVKKAGPGKLFSQGVQVKVLLDESQKDSSQLQLQVPVLKPHPPAKKPNVKAKTTTQPRKSIAMARKPRDIREQAEAVDGRGSRLSVSSSGGFVPDTTLDIPLLADTMRLAPGVTLKEGGSIRRGGNVLKKVQQRATFTEAGAGNGPASDRMAKDVRRNYALNAESDMKSDPLLSSVLRKAQPSVRPIPFPVSVAPGKPGESLGPRPPLGSEYTKLPSIADKRGTSA